ncbi:MAG TPA: cupin domain-containing protein [Chloroflexi bacterium]|nr:MAG: hypothetical protein B6243_13355 [Anaerolineaceae bacterium 4572_5.2]HEY85323.1 cupin domain-containing protein [Chloroflexota bacterium]
MTAQEIIELLNLQPLPKEGGFFRQSYEASEKIPLQALPPRYQQDIAFSTAIYFLLTLDNYSAMHRLITDEIFHFYLGDPVEMLLLYPEGSGEVFILGSDLQAGMRPQKLVPQGVWQGAKLAAKGKCGFALLGTTMSPGFEWEGFELGQRGALIEQYSNFSNLIKARTR